MLHRTLEIGSCEHGNELSIPLQGE